MNDQSYLLDKKLGCYGKVIARTRFPVQKSVFQINDFKIAYFGFSMVLILFISSANAIFIYGLIKTNKTLSYIQKLFIYLSCVDILIACVPIPMYAVYILNGCSCLFMGLTLSFGAMLLISDAAVLFTISLLRFYSIAYPLKRIKYKLVTVFVIIESLSSIMIGGEIFHIYWTGNTLSDFEEVVYLFGSALLGFNTLTIFCISICLWVLKKRSNLTGSDTFDMIQIQQHKRSTITLLIMALLMTVLLFIQGAGYVTLSMNIGRALTNIEDYIATLKVSDITVICSKLNPGLNSVIYICRCKKLKRFYWRMVKRWCGKTIKGNLKLNPKCKYEMNISL